MVRLTDFLEGKVPGQNFLYAVMMTEGELKLKDVPEMPRNRWAPVFAYKRTDGDKGYVVMFLTAIMARDFSNKNFPREWQKGVINLPKEEVQNLINRGIEIEIMTYPKVLYGRDGVECYSEIHYFDDTPELELVKSWKVK